MIQIIQKKNGLLRLKVSLFRMLARALARLRNGTWLAARFQRNTEILSFIKIPLFSQVTKHEHEHDRSTIAKLTVLIDCTVDEGRKGYGRQHSTYIFNYYHTSSI